MIEKVARALCEKWGLDPDAKVSRSFPQLISHPRLGVYGAHIEPPDGYELAWKLIADDVRTGIEAMREPTAAMEQAGESKSYELHNPSTDPVYMSGSPDIVWEAMIEAALAEK